MGKYAKSRAKQWNRSKDFWKIVPENALMEFLFVSLWQADQEVFWKWLTDGIATVSKEFRFGRLVRCESVLPWSMSGTDLLFCMCRAFSQPNFSFSCHLL